MVRDRAGRGASGVLPVGCGGAAWGPSSGTAFVRDACCVHTSRGAGWLPMCLPEPPWLLPLLVVGATGPLAVTEPLAWAVRQAACFCAADHQARGLALEEEGREDLRKSCCCSAPSHAAFSLIPWSLSAHLPTRAGCVGRVEGWRVFCALCVCLLDHCLLPFV
jgi:hypothetical protein